MMALPSPSEADAATQRVRLVAEMLLQKASEVQSKGNAGAAKSLSDSAVDLQRAAALLHELTRHVHAAEPTTTAAAAPVSNGPPRSQDGRTLSNGGQPPPSTSIKDLVAKLGRVDAMLGKKSDEMKAKGNETAANALMQSAVAVRFGAQHIAEQQQMTRTLVVTARALREQLREQWRLLLEGDVEISDETTLDGELRQLAVARVKELLEMRDVVRRFHPEATTAQAVCEALEAPVDATETSGLSDQLMQLHALNERLQQQMQEAQARFEVELRAANEESASMTNQCAVLEKALRELEAEYHERREREIEHLNALHLRQKDTHEELKRLLLAKEEEVSSLKVQAESWMNQLTKERDAQTELQAQREQDRQFHERQVGELRDELQAKNEEILSQKEELRVTLAELELLQQRLEKTESIDGKSLSEDSELQQQITELRQQLEDAQRDRDDLVVSKNEATRAQEAVQAQLIDVTAELEALREQATSVQAETSDGSVRDELQKQIDELLQQIPELRQQLEDAQRDRDDLVVSKNEVTRAQEAVQAQLIDVTAELEALREEATSVQADLTTQMQRVGELEVALASASNQISGCNHDDEKGIADVSELDELHATVEQLKCQLADREKTREELQALLVTTQDTLSAQRSEAEQQIRHLEELREVGAREAEDAKTALVVEHDKQLTEMQLALETERDRVAALDVSLNNQVASADGQSARFKELEDSLAIKETDLAASNERLQQWKATLDRLVDHLERITSLDELHQVHASLYAGEHGVERVLQALHQLIERQQMEETSSTAGLKAELIALRRELSVDSGVTAADDDTTSFSIVKHVHEKVVGVVSELKALQAEHAASLSRHEEEVEAARRETRDVMVKHEAACDELRAQYAHETSALSEKLRAAEADRATTPASNEDETAELRARLTEVENDFERYRTRSHAALKKVEKRAELLNSMRKENEGLVQEMARLKEHHDVAVEQEALIRSELEEVTMKLRKREKDEASSNEEAAAAMQELKDHIEALTKEKEKLESTLRTAEAKTVELQEEKETLANAKEELHEQTLLAKEKALEDVNALVESTKLDLVEANQRIAVLEADMAEATLKIQELETEIEKTRERVAATANGQVEQLQLQVKTLTTRIIELETTVEAKTAELSALSNTKDEERSRAVNELKEQHATALQEASMPAKVAENEDAQVELQVQVAAHAEALKIRVTEVELAKAAAEQEAERLRVEVESLKAASAAAATATSTMDSARQQALQESLEAKEAQIMRLLTELEGLSKHQLEDQRLIAELKEQLRQSELRVSELKQSQSTAVELPASESVDLEALNETIQVLRKRVFELETERADANDDAQPADSDMDELLANRLEKRAQQELEVEKTQRKQRVADFSEKARKVVQELQVGLEEYSSVFRDACALRDEGQGERVTDPEVQGESELNGETNHTAAAEETEYEEYLTFNSGVVIKAGSTFSLPVYCEKPGWRVQWKFAVKEEGADVGYALSIVTKPNDERQEVIAPARVNELSGVCDAPATSDDEPVTAVLQFEWDNTFSWLNEKTLDYHVSVLEPLSVEKKAVRARERVLAASVKTLEQRLELLSQEKERRVQLQERLLLVEACGKEKEDQVSGLEKRKETIKETKTQLQVHMEDLKHKLSALVSELDEIETHDRAVASAWEALQGELDDVDMTMRLSANSRLDELTAALQNERQRLGEELDAVKRKLSSESA